MERSGTKEIHVRRGTVRPLSVSPSNSSFAISSAARLYISSCSFIICSSGILIIKLKAHVVRRSLPLPVFCEKTECVQYYLPRVILRYLSRIRGFCCEALLHSSLPFLSARACCGFAGLPACSTESRAGLPPSCSRPHPTVASPLL